MRLKEKKMTDSFFKRPIVLISAVVIILQAISKFVLSLFGYGMFAVISGNQFYDVNIFELIMGVCLLLFYIFGRQNKPLGFPIKFFKVVSIVELFVVIFMACYALLAMMFFILIGVVSAGFFLLRFFPMLPIVSALIFVIYAVGITAAVSFVLLFISQLVFAVSLKKDNVLQKKRSGAARFYAIMNFILAALFICFVVILIMFGERDAWGLTLPLLISSPSCILIGITAVKYSRAAHNNKAVAD